LNGHCVQGTQRDGGVEQGAGWCALQIYDGPAKTPIPANPVLIRVQVLE